ncbi:tripartite tricarboxylate transporter TctB family protein [Ahrensia kielensis]|uniref:Tripartite tricarboxylate transporter TctB family protein n=1 Tax=Ahrensia kielensis TaxID=76980 RepID=A0ABU9TBP2_9HYPH
MINGRILFNLTLLICSAQGFVLARDLPPAFSPGQIGPGLFPTIVAGLGVLAMIAILIGDLRNGGNAPSSPIGRRAGLGAIAIVGLLIGYIFLIALLGFRISTALFLFLGITVCSLTTATDQTERSLTPKSFGIAALTATVITLVTYSIFTYGFGLNLA